MIWVFRPIQDLIILERLDRIIRRAIRDETHYCEKCGAPVRYSADDAVFLHEDGSYFCPEAA